MNRVKLRFYGCINKAKGARFLVKNLEGRQQYLVELEEGQEIPLLVEGKSLLSGIIDAGWKDKEISIREYEESSCVSGEGPRPGVKAIDAVEDYFGSDDVGDYDDRRDDGFDNSEVGRLGRLLGVAA